MKDTVLKSIYSLAGLIYVPDDLNKLPKKILHISDTPSTIYGSIIRLARKLKPDLLIHTGDIVDDIKLEIVPHKADIYADEANRFLKLLSAHTKDKLIIVPGNHDLVERLDTGQKIKVFKEGQILNIDSVLIGLAHKYEKLPHGCNYYLYGHDRTKGKDSSYLNGIESINIIDITKNNIIKLLYPAGTNDCRMRRTKIGM